jgi:hypothetical protein
MGGSRSQHQLELRVVGSRVAWLNGEIVFGLRLIWDRIVRYGVLPDEVQLEIDG